MNNELSDRQQAIKLRLAGQSVEDICRLLGRSRDWFHTWWRRYRALCFLYIDAIKTVD